ncbi:MAG: hypothetical protein Q9214_000699, partial [Letrouitia sp. 1 TL-2023]
DDRGLDKPPRVADRIEQGQSLLHPIHGLIFKEKLVILRNGNKEQYRCDILKAVDPLLSLGSLTSDIKHPVGQFTDDESGFRDPSGLDA